MDLLRVVHSPRLNRTLVAAVVCTRASPKSGSADVNDSSYGVGISLDEMVVGQWVMWGISLASNVIATALIGYKA